MILSMKFGSSRACSQRSAQTLTWWVCSGVRSQEIANAYLPVFTKKSVNKVLMVIKQCNLIAVKASICYMHITVLCSVYEQQEQSFLITRIIARAESHTVWLHKSHRLWTTAALASLHHFPSYLTYKHEHTSCPAPQLVKWATKQAFAWGKVHSLLT